MLQSYFRETDLIPVLCALLQFPQSIHIREPAPQEFALQFWDQQKLANSSLVIGIMGMLTGSKGTNVCTHQFISQPQIMSIYSQAQESPTFNRCFIEIALASNAPTPLKTQVRPDESRNSHMYEFTRTYRLSAYFPQI